MKVLFLSQRVPWPPDRGDRITTFHFLRHWLERGAEVRVGCLAEAAADDAGVRALRERTVAVCAPRIHRGRRRLTSLRGILTGEALTLPFFRSRALRRTVREWLAVDPPDVIHVYSSSMAQYVMGDLPSPAGRAPLRLMQFAELDSDKWRQYAAHARGPAKWIYAREAARLLRFEAEVARTFDVSFVVSEVERQLFRRCIEDVDPVVLQNGVDVDHFASAGEARREPHAVIFTGVMDYAPNVDGVLWFARECWPSLRAGLPDARWWIVGSKPLPAIRALDGRDGVEVTGRVPETPPWFDRARVAIAPLRLARGVQNKVLEAMSMGLPVVASPQAAQGVGEAPGLLVADGAEATTAAVQSLLQDPARARELGAAAAAWVRAHCRWEHAFARLDEVLRRR